MARGLLSLKPRQRLTPTSSMEATVLATTATDWATTAMATDFTMARGSLRLSPRPRLSPTTATTDLATTDLAEPYYGYYGLGYHGLGYRTYGYGHGLYYGKREAEAEPKAAAEPYYG